MSRMEVCFFCTPPPHIGRRYGAANGSGVTRIAPGRHRSGRCRVPLRGLRPATNGCLRDRGCLRFPCRNAGRRSARAPGAWQAFHRSSLFRFLHECLPGRNRHGAACCLRCLGGVVAKPDACYQIGRISDEPCVARLLGGSRFARCRAADVRRARTAIFHGFLHHRIHHADDLRACHPCHARAVVLV